MTPVFKTCPLRCDRLNFRKEIFRQLLKTNNEKTHPAKTNVQQEQMIKNNKNRRKKWTFRRSLAGTIIFETAIALPIFLIAVCHIVVWSTFSAKQAEMSLKLNETLRNTAEAAFAQDEVFEDPGADTDARLSGNTITFFKSARLNGRNFVRVSTARLFTGRKYNEDETGDKRLVFVAENGRVYHSDRSCSHIRLTVREVTKEDVTGLRNVSGGKYHPCEVCIKGNVQEHLFITDYGDRFHAYAHCSGIKRTIMSMTVDEAKKRRLSPCSKCGG